MSRSFYCTRKGKYHTKQVKYEGKAEYSYTIRLVETNRRDKPDLTSLSSCRRTSASHMMSIPYTQVTKAEPGLDI